MKKTVIVLLALFLALPAVSFAGSATSRWDLTIGGYVKFDMGWGSQNQGVDAALAQQKGNGPFTNINDNTGNFYAYGGETRVNMLTRGPDAWGAKTSAFIEGHFRGDSVSGANASDTFSLRHAFMSFDWANTKIILGHTWQKWGLLPTFSNALLEYNGLGPFLKGSRQPQARIEQNFKNFNWAFAVMSSANTLGASNTFTSGGSAGVNNNFTNSEVPFFEGSIGWTTDKCGKIGPWQMLFNLDGFYGRENRNSQLTVGGVPVSGTWQNKNVDSYGVAFKGFIPVIPEKKGNKAGALSLSGVVFYTQNPGWYQGPVTTSSYNTGTALNPDWHAPVTFGGWGQISYFFTDKLFVNGWYGYTRNNLSNYAISTGQSPIQNTTQMIANVMYDVNAAIRFGVEGAYFNTRYASQGTAVAGIFPLQKDGEYYTFRFGAYYFF